MSLLEKMSANALYTSILDDLNISRSNKGMRPIEVREPYLAENYRECQELSLLKSITKKFLPSTARDPKLAEVAISAFLESNKSCEDFTGANIDKDLLTRVREIFKDIFYVTDIPSWEDLLVANLCTGKGASVASHGKNSFFEKIFVNPFTVTDASLYFVYEIACRPYPLWRAAELRRHLLAGGGFVKVAGSTLTCVSKNDSTDRVVCTEPSLNMVYQKALEAYIYKGLSKRYKYDDVNEAVRNRRFAKEGSKDGRVATLDLKSASDRIPLRALELVLPAEIYAAILDCRSAKTRIKGRWVDLHMVSSMGNGFTFTLMSLLINVIMEAVLDLQVARPSVYKLMGTWGDDIVCPTEYVEAIIQGLESFNFIVNKDKSFWSGPFRESCGTDWFNGHNVRGVYARHLETVEDLFSLINRLNRWSAKTHIPLANTISNLLRTFGYEKDDRALRLTFVPPDESDIAGIKVPASMRGRQHFVGYTAHVPVRRPFALFFGAENRTSIFNGQGVADASKMRETHDNPVGALLSMIDGRLSSRGIDRERRVVKTRRERLWTPTWDNTTDLRRYHVSFTDWEAYVWVNLR